MLLIHRRKLKGSKPCLSTFGTWLLSLFFPYGNQPSGTYIAFFPCGSNFQLSTSLHGKTKENKEQSSQLTRYYTAATLWGYALFICQAEGFDLHSLSH